METQPVYSDARLKTLFNNTSEQVLISDGSVIVDVPCSMTNQWFQHMKNMSGCHEDYDLFVIPTTPRLKAIQDAIATIQTLSSIGVPADKCRVIVNMVPSAEHPAPSCLSHLEKYSRLICDTTIPMHDAFDHFELHQVTSPDDLILRLDLLRKEITEQ